MSGARRPLLSGLVAIAVLVAGFGLWAGLAPIRSAVIAPGRVEVAGGRQPVQHPEGGVVRALLVAEGERVLAGQVLLRLDDAALRPELRLVESQRQELAARRARLVAERDGTGDLPSRDGQGRLLAARREAEAQRIAQLEERAAAAAAQIAALEAEAGTTARQQGLIAGELADQLSLRARGLAPSARVLALEREAAALEGRQAGLRAALAEAGGRAREAGLQIAELAAARRAEAGAALRDLALAEAELAARHDLLAARIAALELRAPVAGTVWGLQLAGAPAVLRAAEPALFLVPDGSPLVVGAEVAPADIGRIAPGQPARLHFGIAGQRHAPGIEGRITRISADVFAASGTGAPFYRLDIALPPVLPPGLVLRPGMPVEVLLGTGARTPAAYLLQPLLDSFHRAFREG